ncbi:MAG: UDP-N-acetylmuramoyl-tripeptide--D-alanyl-D-alanine ligase, partial [Candidatus Korobacteraceae bacterium]
KIAEFIGAGALSPFGFDPQAVATGYSIDSRTLKPGDLYFAVIGERLDGHDYVDDALAAGAVAAVVSREQALRYSETAKLLVVEDTLQALQSLGTAVRKLWATLPPSSLSRRMIAVTGSAGKTTTKEALAKVLSTQLHVLKSEGNLNNHFGLPMQLLRLEPEHDVAVVEMGMSHSGEIAALARIAQPEIGLVTCVAPVHLGFFESVAGIARAKYELIQGLPPGGVAVLNADDEYVSQFGRDFPGKVITFAIHHPANVRAENIHHHGQDGATFQVVVGGASVPARLPLLGEHNIYNALAAIAAALECGVPLDAAVAALLLLAAPDKRGQILDVNGVTVINDCYNSNPKALDSMVDALAAILPARQEGDSPSGLRIVVAGEMLELGHASAELHRNSGRHMAEKKIDVLLGVRGDACEMVAAARQAGVDAKYLETPEAAGNWLAENARAGDVVLLKASRGVRLEQALETWTKHTPQERKVPGSGPKFQQ